MIGKYLGSALLLSASPQTVADPELTGVEEEPVEVKPSGQFSWDETHPPPLHHVLLFICFSNLGGSILVIPFGNWGGWT